MKARLCKRAVFAACAAASISVGAQVGLAPEIVELPTEDFSLGWGNPLRDGERRPAHFDVDGAEREFQCNLTGAFRSASPMRQFDNRREFERALERSPQFVQQGTDWLNQLFEEGELDWALMDCVRRNARSRDEAIDEHRNRDDETSGSAPVRRRAR